MKKTNMIYALLFAGAFASCQKDNVGDLGQDGPAEIVNFTLSARSGGPSFRTIHEPDEDKLVVTWDKGDRIGLFNVVGGDTKNANAVFSIQDDADITEEGKNAVFGGDINQSADWDMDFYAYYPYVSGQNDATKIPVSVADQVIDGTDSKHLSTYDVLVADPLKGVQAGDEETSINFQHIMAIADFDISLPAGAEEQEIREIRIQRANGEAITIGGTVDITAEAEDDRLGITATEEGQSWAQTVKVENVTLAAGESFQARVALIPADWSEETLSIFVNTDKGTYQFDKADIKAEAGKRHNSELVLENKLPVAVGDYYYADGTWSTDLDGDKTVVGVVVYTGQKGGATNGFVMSLEDVDNGQVGKLSNFNIPEIPGSTPPAITSGTEEDWNGQAYAKAVAEKRAEAGYKDMNFILQSLDYVPDGVTDGPATKGNWYTPAANQLLAISANLSLINSRLSAISESEIVATQNYWPSTELWHRDPDGLAALRTILLITGNGQVIAGLGTSSVYPVRPYLSF